MPEITTEAPSGSHFEFEPVRTAKGEQALGEVPILTWDDLDHAAEYYGKSALLNVLDGTSLRVSFQAIARRFAIAGKSLDEIAKAQVDFRPGKRGGFAPTPASKAAKAAKAAVEAVGEDKAAKLEDVLARIASGEINIDDLASLVH